MLLVHSIQSEYMPDPPLHSPWCPSPTPMILQHFFGHVGVCFASSCHCCLVVHTTHSPWHQLQGKGSSSKGQCWRARRRHEDQPGVAVMVMGQTRACTQLDPWDGKHIWWQWHGMGGQHPGLSLCLLQVQLGKWGSLVCCLMSLLLWVLSPKPSLMSSSVYPGISHCVFSLFFTCITSNESLNHLRRQQNSECSRICLSELKRVLDI